MRHPPCPVFGQKAFVRGAGVCVKPVLVAGGRVGLMEMVVVAVGGGGRRCDGGDDHGSGGHGRGGGDGGLRCDGGEGSSVLWCLMAGIVVVTEAGAGNGTSLTYSS